MKTRNHVAMVTDEMVLDQPDPCLTQGSLWFIDFAVESCSAPHTPPQSRFAIFPKDSFRTASGSVAKAKYADAPNSRGSIRLCFIR